MSYLTFPSLDFLFSKIEMIRKVTDLLGSCENYISWNVGKVLSPLLGKNQVPSKCELLSSIIIIIIILDQLLEADKYHYLEDTCTFSCGFLCIRYFTIKSIIKKRKQKQCYIVVKNVGQIMVHTASSMMYSL